MVSKLSENGVAGFILANGALSASGTEQRIRRKLVENDMVEAVIVLPNDMFYTTDLSVSLWILNKDKSGGLETKTASLKLIDRRNNVLFVDARNFGSIYEKKFIRLNLEKDIQQIAKIFSAWRGLNAESPYIDVEELCYSASSAEIEAADFSLVPSTYIKFRDDLKFLKYEENLTEIREEVISAIKENDHLDSKLCTILKHLTSK